MSSERWRIGNIGFNDSARLPRSPPFLCAASSSTRGWRGRRIVPDDLRSSWWFELLASSVMAASAVTGSTSGVELVAEGPEPVIASAGFISSA